MKLQLNRPLCFLDLETTGLNRETDQIVEISVIKLFPDGTRDVKTQRLNPTIPISPGASEVHGIKDADVTNEPTFRDIAPHLLEFIGGCDMAGYNALYFDFPMLYNEFERAGLHWDYNAVNLIDVNNIYKITNPRDLTAAYKHYCSKDLEGAHGAEADALATMGVFLEQIKDKNIPEGLDKVAKFSNYDNEILDLSGKFTYNADGDIVFNFGPHRNEPAKDHLDFVQWMYGKDFSGDTKAICESLLTQTPKEPF